MAVLRGSCLCGGVRYAIDGPLGTALNCHCSMCRKAHGAAFRTRAAVRAETFRWVAGEELLARYESSPGTFRCFCRVCGSPLASFFADDPATIGLPLGALDDDPGVRAAFHVHVAAKAPWHEITDALPRFAELPPAPRRLDYDGVAKRFDQRYAGNDWSGGERALDAFVGAAPLDVLEVGCGTGHWLARLAAQGHRVAGVDASEGMLAKARHTAPGAEIVHGHAEALPWPAARFDRVVAINALHHFPDRDAFLREARRVLRPGGGLLSVGLDPHNGADQWWIYDWFESALALDLVRYRPTAEIRAALAAAGFARAETFVAMHRPAERTFRQLEAEGRLDKTWTSQLTQLTDAEHAEGVAKLRAAAEAKAERGEELVLRADLRLYATTAWADHTELDSRDAAGRR